MKLHFLGIAGHVMRELALAARAAGHEVTGTDAGAKPPGSTRLDEEHITWYQSPEASHLDGVDKVIISGHTQPDDLEVVAAQERDIPIESFAEYVGDATKDARTVVVAGTHGKTTTTTLLTWIFDVAGRNPDFVIGIKPHNFPSSVRLQGGEWAILEGDEYRASQLEERPKFAYYHPNTLVITSLEMDHPDFFADFEAIQTVFRDLVATLPEDGRVYYDHSYPQIREVLGTAVERAVSYGEPADVAYNAAGLTFPVGDTAVTIGLYGRHNAKNASVALRVAMDEGIPLETIQQAFDSFQGASRRFEILSAPEASVTVVDDYAHHPTELATNLEAARLHFGGRVLAVYQPHTYSRTKELLKEYRDVLTGQEGVWLLDVEGAREAHLAKTVSSADIADGLDGIHYQPDRDRLVEEVVAAAQPGDVVLAMTVGGALDLAPELAKRLAEK